MSPKKVIKEAPRINKILKLIAELSAGNYQIREDVSDQGDELDNILIGLNTLAEELSSSSKRLRESEELFRLIAEGVSDLIAVLDLDGKRIYNNPSYKMLGDPISLIGTSSFNEIHPEDREKIRQVFKETVRTGIGQRAEFRFLLPDNSMRYIESQGNVIRDEDGKLSKVVVVSRDITERKQAEESLRKARNELELKVAERTRELKELHEDKDRFISRASHDLRTPIAAILGFSKLLDQKRWGKLNEEQLARVEKIEAHANRLAKIVNDLLTISRIEAGAIGGAKDVVNIVDVIKNVIADMSQVIESKSQFIRFENRSEAGKVVGDRDSIHQVLTNLIDNASKYSDEREEITIISEEQNSEHIVHISDVGIGLSKKDQKRIFDEFFRVELGGETQSQGTGLGLTIVKRLVAQMNGKVWVESKGSGKGSTFSFSLPLAS